jgi:hypothetical protein
MYYKHSSSRSSVQYGANLTHLNLINPIILGEEYKSWNFSLKQFSPPVSSNSFSFKLSPSESVFNHSQLLFQPQSQGTSFTPIQNHRQNCSIVYCKFMFYKCYGLKGSKYYLSSVSA